MATHRPEWFDPSMPAREDCVLKYLLDARAARHPERRIALFDDGAEWTWGQCRERVRRAAAALQSLGVGKGDRVLSWLPSGPDAVVAWFASNYLGAIFVPLNTAYRGAVLAHTINNSRGRLMLAHGSLLGRLDGLGLEHLERVIAFGPRDGAPPAGVSVHDSSVLEDDGHTLDDSADIGPWDIQTIIYTSGTTGASKGVLSPYLQLYTTAVVNYGYLREGEAALVDLPLFHVGGTSGVYCPLVRGGSFYLVDGFSTEKYWDRLRRGNCVTTSGVIGVMVAFLAKAEPRPDDANNPLRRLTGFPINEQMVALSRRFGFEYFTGFNMTEVSSPLVSDVNPTVFGSCGRPRSGVTCRIVDGHDLEVPRGAVGELIVRSDLPWTMNAGYDNMPEATATAWRNGWFHTGDLFRQDEDGNYFFVDRLKDSIRRRGENISSVEVENAVRMFPGVDTVVAVGVPGEFGEEEVLVAVVPGRGASIDPLEMIRFLVPRLPYFMVPRYVRVMDDIPKTATNKLRKVEIRDAGVTADTWDREAAGLHLKRERL